MKALTLTALLLLPLGLLANGPSTGLDEDLNAQPQMQQEDDFTEGAIIEPQEQEEDVEIIDEGMDAQGDEVYDVETEQREEFEVEEPTEPQEQVEPQQQQQQEEIEDFAEDDL